MFKKIVLTCAIAFGSAAAPASVLPEYPFIHVSASAELDAVPDIGTIDFVVAAADADPAAARAVVEARVADIRALVEAQGLPLDDVEVRNVRQDVRKGEPAAPAPLYDLTCDIHLNVRKLSAWQPIAGALLGMPNLDGFSVAFDTSEREQVEAQLMEQAIRDARRKGAAMAAGFGRKLGPVAAVSAGSLKNLGNAMGLVAADFFQARGNGPRADKVDRRDMVNINILKLAQPVDVIFRIK